MTFRLSRYACVRRDRDRLVAEGRPPGEPYVLDDPFSIALIYAFARAMSAEEAARTAGLSVESAAPLIAALLDAGVLVDAEAAARETRSFWSFDAARAHAQARRFRTDPPGELPRRPADALPPDRGWPAVALPVPDLDAIERDDPPLAAVQAARRSVRARGDGPIAFEALAEFLFRVGRVEDLWTSGGMIFAARPYPSAGALYELELYVVAEECAGLDPGLYHYVSAHHRLARAPGPLEAAHELGAAAARGMDIDELPQALVILALRFDRIAWKYGELAYSLVLKNVGVVLHAMYLVATAMGLGACAIGTGDSHTFASATGLAPEAETSVGELALWSPQSSTLRA